MKFPWRVLSIYFGFQALAALISLALLRYFSGIASIVAFLVFHLVCSAWLAWRYARSLKSSLVQTQMLAYRGKFSGSDEDDLFEVELGEFEDLNHYLTLIEKRLKRRKRRAQELQEEITAFMESVDDAFVGLDREGKIRFFNAPFSHFFISTQVDKKNLDLTEVCRHPKVNELARQALSSDGSKKTYRDLAEVTIQDQIQPRVFAISFSPLRNQKSNEIYGAVGIFHDLTSVKLADKVRSDFVANASHELKTPLTSMIGYIETLKSDLQNGRHDQSQQFVEVIRKQVTRMNQLVSDLLLLSNLESGIVAKKEIIAVDEIVQHVFSQLSGLAREKNQRIVFRGGAGEALLDPLGVELILANLISNAIKYCSSNSIIDVKTEKTDRSFVIRVKDNGPGISEEHQARLFERFYRVDQGRSREMGGTGLGLSIVKHIMMNHGGTVAIESRVGEGTEFICEFPQ